MKFYSVVRYGPTGQPIKFYNWKFGRWENEIVFDCFSLDKDFIEGCATRNDGFVEVHNVVRGNTTRGFAPFKRGRCI